MTATASEQRRLIHAVAAASDEQLAGIVALFDRLADRREADRLLDAARPRLRRMRPPRPIGLPRLLFLPLDGVIAEARSWRRQDGGLPRSALMPITDAIRLALGAEAGAIEAMTAGHSFADIGCVASAGQRLWRGAAAVAMALPQPAGWAETGLSPADFRHAMQLCGGVWRHAEPLLEALLSARDGPPPETVQAAMAAAAGEQAMVTEAMLATILLKAARPGSVVAAATAAPAGTADRVLDRWLDACEPMVAGDDPHGAARLAEAFAEALDDLEDLPRRATARTPPARDGAAAGGGGILPRRLCRRRAGAGPAARPARHAARRCRDAAHRILRPLPEAAGAGGAQAGRRDGL
jgi:hypothetical protein